MSDPNNYQIPALKHTFFEEKDDTGRGSEFLCNGAKSFAVFIVSDEVTDGATIDIEAKRPDGEWHVIDSVVVTEDGNQEVIISEANPFDAINVNISAIDDGEYTASATAQL